MSNKILLLNLPSLPTQIEQVLVETCRSIPLKEQDRQWVNLFHKNELPIAAHSYGLQSAPIPKDVVEFIQQYLKAYFGQEELIMFVGILKNVVGQPSTSPPHCDRAREMAINYVLSTGGDNVQTCFYKEHREIHDITCAENKYYKDCTLDFKIKFPEKVWHAYNVQRYHSVENIEHERYLFSIKLKSNPTIDQFLVTHHHLVQTDQYMIDDLQS